MRINGIARGAIEVMPGFRKPAPGKMKCKTREYVPLYRAGERWDIAMAALYLASNAGWLLFLVFLYLSTNITKASAFLYSSKNFQDNLLLI